MRWDEKTTVPAQSGFHSVRKNKSNFSLFFFFFLLLLKPWEIAWSPPTLGSMIWFTQFLNLNVDLIWKWGHRIPRTHVQLNIWAPYDKGWHIKLTTRHWRKSVSRQTSRYYCNIVKGISFSIIILLWNTLSSAEILFIVCIFYGKQKCLQK